MLTDFGLGSAFLKLLVSRSEPNSLSGAEAKGDNSSLLGSCVWHLLAGGGGTRLLQRAQNSDVIRFTNSRKTLPLQ